MSVLENDFNAIQFYSIIMVCITFLKNVNVTLTHVYKSIEAFDSMTD